jgi:flagellar basal-body rod protein FlgF
MDRMLYVSMTGAKQILEAQGIVSHNLANVSTTGFRADLHAFASQPIPGGGFPTRVNAYNGGAGISTETGPVTQTGRPLDVAIDGDGWLAVQAPDGTEAYTRAGDLRLTPDGDLITASGMPVLGDGGPISLPPADEVEIGGDGTITIVPQGIAASNASAVARLKLVNVPAEQLVKGDDGLLRAKGGRPLPADASVRVIGGSLEGSNVNAARALVEMIEFQRLFDMQVKLMSTADQNAQTAQRLLQSA